MDALALKSMLDNAGRRSELLADGAGGAIVLLARGARVIGIFPGKDDRNLLWVHPDAANAADWNTGGDRTWISPELEYFVKSADSFEESYSVPGELDPGRYAMEMQDEDRRADFSQSVSLRAYRSETDSRLTIGKTIALEPDPVRLLSASLGHYRYIGYDTTVRICDNDPERSAPAASWSIMQVPAGGAVWIPTYGQAEIFGMFGPIDASDAVANPGLVQFRIDASRRFKGSIKAHDVTGRIAYYREEGESAHLLVRSFYPVPSRDYRDAPRHSPDDRGHCVQVYSDDGTLGSFGELEYHTPVIDKERGERSLTDRSQVWAYSGRADTIAAIRRLLIGH
ncbi:DUF6786 family protein [Cohnella sp. GCM10020058]|uniref:DUF6786 family protein n=1 Tax=Cohnella sp. GCM10020058 TaxID=3317330 RepID=UPI003640998C